MENSILKETEAKTVRENEDNILEVRGLKKYFPIRGGFFNTVVGQVKAIDGISFSIKRGSTMGWWESPVAERPPQEEPSCV